MRKFLLIAFCLIGAGNLWAQKIDFDFQGKTGGERHTEQGYLNWPIASRATEADTLPRIVDGAAVYPATNSVGGQQLPAGMQIICSCVSATPEEGMYNGIVSAWAKNNVESNTLSKLVGDAVCTTTYNDDHDRFDTNGFSTLRFIIKGMSPGTHTITAWHNCVDKGHGQPPMVKVMVNGEDAAAPVQQTIWADAAQSLEDVPSTFVSFTVEEGKDVTIDYVAVPADGVEYTNHRVYVCGMVFDAADPNMKVSAMRPMNGDLHVDNTNGTATLSWTGAASAVTHRVMFGTSEDNLQEVQNTSAESYTATGLSPLNTYYWRVDEVPAAGDPVLGEVYSFRINHLAFPGAEGFGRYAHGGRAGQVVHVTSLEDTNTEGTLRYALETVTGPRTVVFDVSGIINITKRITVNDPYVTIAGQTAPGDGILIRGNTLTFGNEGIIRFIRHRMGTVINEEKGTGYSGIDLQGKNNTIIDHSSIGWATAETLKASGNYTNNITVQHTIIHEALTNGSAGSDGFGTGFEAGGEHGSFHHNLMAGNYNANMNISGGQDAAMKWIGEEECYNNVAYNWGNSTASGSAAKFNFVGNYYKTGPATPSSSTNVLNINVPKNGSGSIEYYVSGNIFENNGTTTDNPYNVNEQKDEDGNPVEGGYVPVKSDTKLIDNGAVYEDARTAYANVLSQAGASLKRDATDKRIINEVSSRTSSKGENGMISEIDAESDYDVYENVSRASDFDANQNGIADWYETATGRTDANADPDGDGYTNLEDYLNYMATPNQTVAPGETATFNLSDYFAGINGATYSVEGKGAIEGGSLNIATSASDQGFLKATVTAAAGEVKVVREFNVYLSGTQTGISRITERKALVQSYELYNTAGQLIRKGHAEGVSVDRLNLNGVKAGVYIMKIKDTEGNTRSFSVLKK
ncbi:MAG: T9SS type A sorting domain-containing protein [Prevotella sp.]|nr:T9SS type A sorting domain-containing protein [Prevotella sp.]